MDFLKLKIAELSKSKITFFFSSSIVLAILPWPPSVQTFITISSTLWLNEKYEVELKYNVIETSPALDAKSLAWWKEYCHRFPNIATHL